ncbi:UPF0545 protein C22orf39 homolog isoform X2 [Betta splendens]|uniref:Synaptic plasticity regulator PANTS n=1 Tax=Betta splendens TaxID=158456 RepID=A0A9W2Y043_BETSP|nr:UPF0545 protein C22orf39 homolog isoform X2 [Betta splendens]
MLLSYCQILGVLVFYCERSKTRKWLCRRAQPPRVCDNYWSEFKHCKSLSNRFHHYYTYGTTPSCQQWKEDYYNCREWEKHKGTEAKGSVVATPPVWGSLPPLLRSPQAPLWPPPSKPSPVLL